MSTLSLRELRDNLGNTIRAVAHTGHEAIITDSGKEVAVIIAMDDYERLHEHADMAAMADYAALAEARDAEDDAYATALRGRNRDRA